MKYHLLLSLGVWTLAGLCAHAQDSVGPAVLPPPTFLQELPETIATSPDGPELVLPAPAEELIADAVDEAIVPPPLWYQPAYWLGPYPWDAGVELGINGGQGNKEFFSMRSGGYAKRATPNWKLDSSLVYNKNHTEGVETQNNGKHDARFDRILNESPWTLFVLENLIYDEFQSYDVQLSLNSGVGYQWIKNDATDLLTRIGAGATREFGAVVDDWQPQALFGLDFTQQISKTQRFAAKIDYFPEWQDFNQFRVVSDFSYQIDLDRPKNVSLKLSAIDWYDSTPDEAEPNTLNYAVLMIWKL